MELRVFDDEVGPLGADARAGEAALAGVTALGEGAARAIGVEIGCGIGSLSGRRAFTGETAFGGRATGAIGAGIGFGIGFLSSRGALASEA